MFLCFICFTAASACYVVIFSSEVDFFMSSIRVLALKIVLTWNLFSWFIYFGRVPIFQLLIPSSRCFSFYLELPALLIIFGKSIPIAFFTFCCWHFVVSVFLTHLLLVIFSPLIVWQYFFQFWLLSISVIVVIRFKQNC